MATCVAQANMVKATGPGLQGYLQSKIEGLEFSLRDRSLNLKRLEAQRNNLNSQGARLVMEPTCAHHSCFRDGNMQMLVVSL